MRRARRLASRIGLATAIVLSPAWAAATTPGTGWIRHDNPAPVSGADGKRHAATCSGYPGTDPAFRFWSKAGTAKDLVVFFEGGGACWDSRSCTFPSDPELPHRVPQFFVPAIAPDAGPAGNDGIFDTANAANPVKDWSFVYIPYCTGDLHLGSATRQYANAGHPVLTLPSSFTIQHRGFDNFMVVLDWIRKNFETPRNILVTGSSAGGYGASANFVWLQEAYPKARVYVIADASQGVSTPAFDVGNPGRNAWNPQLAPWVYGYDPSLLSGPDLLQMAAAAYPRVRVSQFTTNADDVQIEFYGLMKQYYRPAGSCANVTADWNKPDAERAALLRERGRQLPLLRGRRDVSHDHAEPELLHGELRRHPVQPLGRRDAAEPRRRGRLAQRRVRAASFRCPVRRRNASSSGQSATANSAAMSARIAAGIP